MQEQPLIVAGNYPRFNATGMADCHLLSGGRASFTMWDWLKVDGVWRRVVAGVLTRPLEGLSEDQARYWRAIRGANAPTSVVTLQ